jgi:Flp pilus assembly protein TadG
MKNLTNDRGSIIVFITLMIVVLMVMVGFGLDTGYMTYSRNTAQSAVDAAALAAISALPTRNPATVQARAAVYNSNNNYTGSSSNPIISTNVSYVSYDYVSNTITDYNAPIATANGVRVAMETANGRPVQSPAFLTPLLRLMGNSASSPNNVNVSAVATIQTRPAIPIALWETKCGTKVGTPPQYPLQPNVKIQMQHPAKDNQDPAGENACWTTFFDCSSGAPDIKAGFTTASTCSGASIDGNISIGSMICQNKGQVNTVLGEAEDFFLKTPSNLNQWFIIPVLSGGGNCSPDNPTGVVDFAKIRVSAIDKTGNPKYILADIQCGQGLDSTDSSLCFTHRLVRENTPGKDKGY